MKRKLFNLEINRESKKLQNQKELLSIEIKLSMIMSQDKQREQIIMQLKK